MSEIDQPFKPKTDFYIAWGVVTVATVLYTKPWSSDLPWYSEAAFALVVPLFFTFIVYGPFLLLRQILRSRARGWFVLRGFLLLVLAAVLVLVSHQVSGRYSGATARYCAALLMAGVVVWFRRRATYR